MATDFQILGPLKVLHDGQDVAVSGEKQRALLAVLLLHANETLTAERLIDELWGEHPPPTAAKAVQVHVSRLRKALAATNGTSNGHASLVTRDRGYRLELDPESVDAQRFEARVTEARRELADGHPEQAIALLEDGLALWHGEPLADLAYEPFAQREIARLEDLRLTALEQLIEAKLAVGRHTEVVAELERLVAEHPYRERLRAQLMLALYRCDRQADALQAYQNARRQLVEELGIEPTEMLRDLERAILAQDPELELPPPEVSELPHELVTTHDLIGREPELAWLRDHWKAAESWSGRVALVTGDRGVGKTRLAAELAAEAFDSRAKVLYVPAHGGQDQRRAALAAARAARRPTLLVLDDVDQGGPGMARALSALEQRIGSLPLLVLATATSDEVATLLDPDASLPLGPLDAQAVTAIARSYAGDDGVPEPPVDELLAASRGIAADVHRVTREWARAETTRRLGAAAERAADGRTGLRAAEDELAGSVVALQSVQARVEQGLVNRVVSCPFKGLESYNVRDADVFFGRERLVAEMVARLAGAPLMGIVGPSGSGKSSALRAGLLASLYAGVLPGSERWGLALFRPGEDPVAALDDALAGARGHERLVIAVDQFEELFTACDDETRRAQFVEALIATTRDRQRPATVLLAIRADYYGRCATYPELSRMLAGNQVLVGPMRRDEVRRAIEMPARRAGLQVEPELVEALVADVEDEPGALPLLSTSLLELWQHRDGFRLRLADYEHLGGVQRAVARLAERAYERLEPERREVARKILLRLAGEGEGDTVVRRRVQIDELDAEHDPRVRDVLASLANERLVSLSEHEAEVAHEALLREWPRLREWLDEDTQGRHLHHHLAAVAREWDAGGRDPGELYRGARLAAALDWAASHDDDLNTAERAFLDESRAASERSQRRLRAVLAGVAALLVVAVVAGAVALGQRGQARDAAVVADAQRLGAGALTEARIDRALLLAQAGVGLDASRTTRGNLLSVLFRSPAALGVLNGDGWPLFSTAISRDGRLYATGDERGTVTIFDARTRRVAGRYEIKDGFIQTLNFSPDGRTLAVSAQAPQTKPLKPAVDLVDVRSLRRLRRFVLPPLPYQTFGIFISVAFLPNGRDLITQQTPFDYPEGGPTVLRRLNARTGAIGRGLRLGKGSAFQIHPTADGRRVFTSVPSEQATYEVDAERVRVIRRHAFGDGSMSVSADGRLIALGSDDGTVRLVDLASGKTRDFEGRHENSVGPLVFTPDGRTLVSSASGDIFVWDVERGTIRERLRGHAGEVPGLRVSRDGRTLISVGKDTRTLLWDLSGERRLVQPFDGGAVFETEEDMFPRSLAISPDGRDLALAQIDGTVRLVDAATLEQRRTFEALRGFAAAVRFSPDGGQLAVAGENGQIVLLDARTGRALGELEGLQSTSQELEYSPDGRRVAAAGLGDPGTGAPDGVVLIWDARTGELTGEFKAQASASLSFSPDGRFVAANSVQRGAVVHDVRTSRRVALLYGRADYVRSVEFSPDGSLLAVGSYHGLVRLFSTRTWKPVGRALDGHDGRVISMSFTPDGDVLATAGQEGDVIFWDVKRRRQLGSPMTVEAEHFANAVLTRDGKWLFAASNGTRAVRFPMSPAAWTRHACRVAGRELTQQEWKDALPDRDYQPVCGRG